MGRISTDSIGRRVHLISLRREAPVSTAAGRAAARREWFLGASLAFGELDGDESHSLRRDGEIIARRRGRVRDGSAQGTRRAAAARAMSARRALACRTAWGWRVAAAALRGAMPRRGPTRRTPPPET